MISKKSYKKFRNWLKLTSYTSMLAFLTVCFILLVIFTYNILCSADSNNVVLSEYYDFYLDDMGYQYTLNWVDAGLNPEIEYTGDLFGNPHTYTYPEVPQNSFFSSNTNTGTDLPQSLLYNYFTRVGSSQCVIPESFTIDNTVYNLEDYPYFLVMAEQGNYNDYRVVLSQTPFIQQNYDALWLFMTESPCIIFLYDNYSSTPTRVPFIGDSLTFDSKTYYNASAGSYYYSPVISNTSINVYKYSTRETNTSGIYETFLDRNSVIDINYMGNGSNTDTNDGSGGTDNNNLYLRSANWVFNVPKYWNEGSTLVKPQYTSQWGSGNISYTATLNDYQKLNANKFDLVFSFQIIFSAEQFSDTNNTTKFYNRVYGYSEETVSLSTFIQNSNINTWSVSDIFDSAILGNPNSNNETFTAFLNTLKSANSLRFGQWYIRCNSKLVSKSGGQSGSLDEAYNFLNGNTKKFTDDITNNKDPYIPDDSKPNPLDPNTPTDSSSSDGTHCRVTVTNNNNPTFNNNVTVTTGDNNISNVVNDSGNPLTRLIDALFGNGTVQEGSIGGSTTDQLIENTGASNWLTFMEHSFSWIPAGVVAEFGMFIMITLGILVVAFILRIILDFL